MMVRPIPPTVITFRFPLLDFSFFDRSPLSGLRFPISVFVPRRAGKGWGNGSGPTLGFALQPVAIIFRAELNALGRLTGDG
jgi:hypothetical protein